MSQQKQEGSGFLSGHKEAALANQEEENGGLGGFLSSKLGQQEQDSEPIQYGEFEKTSNYAPSVFFHSSEDMGELDDESVHFAITSPPYNTGWSYGSYDDAQDYATEYLPMLARVFKEVHRVLVPGARFVVNVPSLLRSGASGGFPIAADISRMMTTEDGVYLTMDPEMMWGEDPQELHRRGEFLENKMPEDRPGYALNQLMHNTDWVMREQIAWFKDFNTDGLAPNGSFPRPWGILLNNMHEVCMVFQKPGKRDFSDMDEDLIERSKINKRDSDMCDDVWFINPDSWSPKHTEEDIPVFPEKLVRRAIQLWTYEEDTVLDPFAGRFTTGKVAKDLRRYGVGYELREDLKEDIERFANVYETGLYQFTE